MKAAKPVVTDVRPCEQLITLCNGATRIWSYGNEQGPTIILLHGYRGDHHGLEGIATQLDGFHVVVPDLPGFGASDPLPLGSQGIDGFARWAGDLVRAMAPDGEAILVGHSFGSIVVAATLANRNAPRVRAAVLINPIAAPALAGKNRAATQVTVQFHRFAGALPESMGTKVLSHPLVGRVTGLATMTTKDPQLRRWIHGQHARYFSVFADRRSLLAAFDAATRAAVGDYARRIQVPTLLIAGGADILAPVRDQEQVERLLPDGRLKVIPGIGHLTHYEAPVAVAASIRAFVNGTME